VFPLNHVFIPIIDLLHDVKLQFWLHSLLLLRKMPGIG
jgi:hypothetical protein